MKKLFTLLCVAVVASTAGFAQADDASRIFNITNITFDNSPSIVDDTDAIFQIRMNVDVTSPTDPKPVVINSLTIFKDGVDIGSQGYAAGFSTIGMSTFSNNLAVNLAFDGSGTSFANTGSSGGFSITFNTGDGSTLESYWNEVNSWTFTGGFTGSAMAIPEPATAGLLATGLFGFAFLRRRRK